MSPCLSFSRSAALFLTLARLRTYSTPHSLAFRYALHTTKNPAQCLLRHDCLLLYHITIQNWLGRQDSNLRMTESESVALPLGDAPVLGWIVGFEPTHAWTTTMCLNHLTIPTKVATRNGLEPSTSSVTGWHSNQLNYRATYGSGEWSRTTDLPGMNRTL